MKAKRQKQLEALRRLLASLDTDRHMWTMAGAEVLANKPGSPKREIAEHQLNRYQERIKRQEDEAIKLRELTSVTYTTYLEMRNAGCATAEHSGDSHG